MSGRHLMITVPKTESWVQWMVEAIDADRFGGRLFFRVPHRPKSERLADPCKVFVVHDGTVRGYHEAPLSGLFGWSEGFTCATTGRPWPAGWYLIRCGKFHQLAEPVPMRGFQGWRYCEDWSER